MTPRAMRGMSLKRSDLANWAWEDEAVSEHEKVSEDEAAWENEAVWPTRSRVFGRLAVSHGAIHRRQLRARTNPDALATTPTDASSSQKLHHVGHRLTVRELGR